MSTWQDYLAANRDRFVEEYLDFLRIPSVSTLPEHKDDVERAAEWAANRLRAAGLEAVEIMPTAGHPVVYGEWLHAPGKPTILIYGHVDVQPVDPLAEWTHPPFEPAIVDGKVYARGATDMKGNLLLAIIGVEALLKAGRELPVNVKFCVEAEEEIASPSLAPLLAAQHERFACDLAVSADGSQNPDRPALIVGWRGLAGLQIDVRSAAHDVHSGAGGFAPNAAHVLVRILDSLRGPGERILVDGFYDDVLPLSEADRAQIAAGATPPNELKRMWGIDVMVGEPGYTPAERGGSRPTLEINGMWAGYQGEGTKTVIPCEAHAKITCRLVPNQEPARVRDLIARHVAMQSPEGMTVSVRPISGDARPYLMPADHWGNRAAGRVLRELYGKEPIYRRGGGTLPVTTLFRDILGAYTITVAFSALDERLHAPDEFYRLANFELGQRAYCLLLEELGQAHTGP
jgi:acetylornithine deacetylase/succinyl-diaminopimelate desuccinylase-like protein